jgi:hypothetical protein
VLNVSASRVILIPALVGVSAEILLSKHSSAYDVSKFNTDFCAILSISSFDIELSPVGTLSISIVYKVILPPFKFYNIIEFKRLELSPK